jgi:hypothetical protein
MGSSGSGRISDYPGTSKGGGNGGGSTGGGGGQPPEDRCGRAFSTPLEDIEHSEYYQAHRAPPPVGEPLQIRQRKRLVAETAHGQSVGNIPTGLNFLAACLKDGWSYTGRVTASNNGPPLATVTADFAAIPPP